MNATDPQHLDELKRRIAAGAYVVDPVRVAAALLCRGAPLSARSLRADGATHRA